jgi:hypothetical protein
MPPPAPVLKTSNRAPARLAPAIAAAPALGAGFAPDAATGAAAVVNVSSAAPPGTLVAYRKALH